MITMRVIIKKEFGLECFHERRGSSFFIPEQLRVFLAAFKKTFYSNALGFFIFYKKRFLSIFSSWKPTLKLPDTRKIGLYRFLPPLEKSSGNSYLVI